MAWSIVDSIKRGEPVREPDKIAKMQVAADAKCMKPLLAAAALSAALAGPASATEWMNCGDGEEKASFEVLLGSLDVIAIDTIEIERRWQAMVDQAGCRSDDDRGRPGLRNRRPDVDRRD